jgi:hypothetical protein
MRFSDVGPRVHCKTLQFIWILLLVVKHRRSFIHLVSSTSIVLCQGPLLLINWTSFFVDRSLSHSFVDWSLSLSLCRRNIWSLFINSFFYLYWSFLLSLSIVPTISLYLSRLSINHSLSLSIDGTFVLSLSSDRSSPLSWSIDHVFVFSDRWNLSLSLSLSTDRWLSVKWSVECVWCR